MSQESGRNVPITKEMYEESIKKHAEELLEIVSLSDSIKVTEWSKKFCGLKATEKILIDIQNYLKQL